MLIGGTTNLASGIDADDGIDSVEVGSRADFPEATAVHLRWRERVRKERTRKRWKSILRSGECGSRFESGGGQRREEDGRGERKGERNREEKSEEKEREETYNIGSSIDSGTETSNGSIP